MDPVRLKALELAHGLAPTPKNLERVGAEASPEASRWAFGQWELRERGLSKFALAPEMLFDRDGLQMASHERVAAYHASCFPAGVLVADLTAGIGADLIALARRGPAVGFELDAERAEMAVHNLAVAGVEAEIVVADSLEADWDFECAIADPARRVESRRTLRPEEFSPNPVTLSERMAGLKLGGLKLSPLLPDPFLESLGPRLEFVSFGHECREALVWMGSSAEEGRVAMHVESGEILDASEDGGAVQESMSEYFYEADPAAIRGHCLPVLASSLGLKLVGESNGYLTSSDLVSSVWLRGYRVLADHPADVGVTGRALRSFGSGVPVVKTREPGVDVDRVRKSLRGEGALHLVVVVYAIGKKLRHCICEPLRSTEVGS